MVSSTGIQQLNYPVRDLAKAKALYRQLLGVEPYMDTPYYVGFRVGEGQGSYMEIGLDPNGFRQGLTGPVGFYPVADIRQAVKELEEAGAQVLQPARDVGGGKLVAVVKDADGNGIGLIQG